MASTQIENHPNVQKTPTIGAVAPPPIPASPSIGSTTRVRLVPSPARDPSNAQEAYCTQAATNVVVSEAKNLPVLKLENVSDMAVKLPKFVLDSKHGALDFILRYTGIAPLCYLLRDRAGLQHVGQQSQQSILMTIVQPTRLFLAAKLCAIGIGLCTTGFAGLVVGGILAGTCAGFYMQFVERVTKRRWSAESVQLESQKRKECLNRIGKGFSIAIAGDVKSSISSTSLKELADGASQQIIETLEYHIASKRKNAVIDSELLQKIMSQVSETTSRAIANYLNHKLTANVSSVVAAVNGSRKPGELARYHRHGSLGRVGEDSIMLDPAHLKIFGDLQLSDILSTLNAPEICSVIRDTIGDHLSTAPLLEFDQSSRFDAYLARQIVDGLRDKNKFSDQQLSQLETNICSCANQALVKVVENMDDSIKTALSFL